MSDLFAQFFANKILWAAFSGWVLAQIIKVPLEYALHRNLDWSLLLSSGGMPSSHSALVTGMTVAVGVLEGFNSPLFAIALVVAVIVIYDALGVRRQAGDHARVINLMIDELLTGHPLAEKELKEMLGHTPREVIGGVVLGLATSIVVMNVL